ncbi:NUDIX domain-containing protein [Hydrogenophaga sp. 5NK40-0174]|uniref:NUDIX domain-containing protein n=1 Tax=Hydrogenophaga sp. 5NK40-0174 TaxID=3127649 RepID=UPI00333E525F
MVDGGSAVDGSSASERKVVEVAVGVLIDEQGRFLLTTRPEGKVYAGYWEFPGGKVERGETVEQALRRELLEELGVSITAAAPWRDSYVDYPHALVHLNFCKVRAWSGSLQMREGQSFSWQVLPVTCEPVLAGTVPVLDWLAQEAQGGPSPRAEGRGGSAFLKPGV